MKGRRRSKLGYLLFFVPIALIVGLIVYSVYVDSETGTLVITAMETGSNPITVHAKAVVGGKSGETPFNVSLYQGTYTVVFESVPWYHPAESRVVPLSAGKTEYAVGEYAPIVVEVVVTSSGFNATKVDAMHGVTPVVWLNHSGHPFTLEGTAGNGVYVASGDNYTRVFQSAGTYSFSEYNTSFSGSVVVQ